MTDTREYNFVRLRERAERAEAAVEGTDVALIADTILRSGYHPYAGGRSLLEILVRRHRDQSRPPLIPTISQTDVVELADQYNISPQFGRTTRLEI